MGRVNEILSSSSYTIHSNQRLKLVISQNFFGMHLEFLEVLLAHGTSPC